MTPSELIERAGFAMLKGKPHIFKHEGRWVAFCHHTHQKLAQHMAFEWVSRRNALEKAK